jgi:hypothetical protein
MIMVAVRFIWCRIMFLVMVMVVVKVRLRIMFMVMVMVVVKVMVKNHVLGHGTWSCYLKSSSMSFLGQMVW